MNETDWTYDFRVTGLSAYAVHHRGNALNSMLDSMYFNVQPKRVDVYNSMAPLFTTHRVYARQLSQEDYFLYKFFQTASTQNHSFITNDADRFSNWLVSDPTALNFRDDSHYCSHQGVFAPLLLALFSVKTLLAISRTANML